MRTKRCFLTLLAGAFMCSTFVANAAPIMLEGKPNEEHGGGGGVLKQLVPTKVITDYEMSKSIGVTLLTDDNVNVAMKILDNTGRVIYSRTVDPSQTNDVNINVSTFNTGTYKISLKHEETGEELSGEFVVN